MSDAMDLKKLAAPFRESEYEWRLAQSGKGGQAGIWAKCLCYLTARAVMDRLDEVVGPENWKVSYTHETGGVMAHLSIRCGEEWITKSDGAENTEIEGFKGGISGALKRAAVAWGIGRLLYHLPEAWAQCSTDTRKYPNYGKTKDGTAFSWAPPSLLQDSPWAVAGGEEPPPAAPRNGNGTPPDRNARREQELSLEGDTAPFAFPGSDVPDLGKLQQQYQDLAQLLLNSGLDVRERGYERGESRRLDAEELKHRIGQMKHWVREVV